MKTTWRNLNIEQMATWPDAPRRGLLLILALCALLLGAVYMLLPLYEQWQQAVAETQILQQRYVAGAQKHGTSTMQTQPVKNTELSIWLAELAIQAEAQGLHAIQISPTAIESKTIKNLGQLTIKAEGDDAKMLQWWVTLAASPRVLSMAQIELTGIDQDRVRGQVNVVFAQEALP